MAFQDIKVKLLQVLRIAYPEPEPVSGDVFIAVENKLQYNSLFPLTEDGDIVYKAWITANVGNKVFLDETDTAYVNITGGGVITISDWQTDFSALIGGNMVEAMVWYKQNGVWYDLGRVVPDITFDVTDALLETLLWTLNIDVSSFPIQKIKIRLT